MDKINTNNSTITHEFYAYSWHVDEEYQDETFIRIYGFDDQSQNICVSVNGFRPFVWVELPTHIDWKNPGNKERLYLYFHQTFPNVKCTLKFCKKLYGANLKKKKDGKYTSKLFPYLLCSFSSYRDLKFNFPNKLKNSQRIMGLGNLRFRVHGQDACPRLQLTSKYNLPTAGWIKFKGVEILDEDDKFTSCDREFLVDLTCKTKDSKDIISASSKTTIPKPLILSFDLEVNSEDTVTMPKATRPGDVVFQISCIFSRLGSSVYDEHLLSLGDPKEKIVGANVRKYSTEKKLLMGFRDIVNEKNPNVIIGYNIFNFDIPYLMDRANHKTIYPEWSQQGFAKRKSGIQREIKWSSSAYKNQEFRYLECEGRLYIDLLPVVQRDFKLNDYKLKTVSSHFIGETKDDLDPKSIFRCYREGIKNQLLIIIEVEENLYKLFGVESEDDLKTIEFANKVTDVFMVENFRKSITNIHSKVKHLVDQEDNVVIKYEDLKYMVVREAKSDLLKIKHNFNKTKLQVDNLSKKYMSICGKYCMQDSRLVMKLMEKLTVWHALAEMAIVCNVPMITLFTKGQQIKVYSNLYKYCLENKFIPEKDAYTVSENERYVGAYVFPPIPGLYENVVALDFCVAGDTLISTPSGTSIKIQDIKNMKVNGCDESYRINSFQMIGGKQSKGLKETVKIILQDRREIVTTPDHKFMLEDGSWCEAQNLENKKIKCSIEQPEDKICPNEKKWTLEVDGYTFNFLSSEERSKTLAFSRILGYVLADGSIYRNKNTGRVSSEAYFGTMVDANIFKEDLKLVLKTLKYDSIGCRQRTTSKGTCIYVTIPTCISRIFASISGVMIGKRSSQTTKLPEFLMDDSCPKSVIREFLGGLFGGDGTAPYMSKNKICTMSFKWDTIYSYQDDLIKVFKTLKNLIFKFEIDSTLHESRWVNVVTFKPKDEDGNHRVNCVLSLPLDEVYKFQDKIGFRYCINKSNKLFVVSSYQKFQNKVREHFNFALDEVNDLIKKMTVKNTLGKTGSKSPFNPCLKIVYEKLDNMHVLDPISYISKTELNYQRGEQKRHADKSRKLSLSSKKFIQFSDFIEQIGAKEWFATSPKEKKYSVKSEDITSPTLNFIVKYIIPNGIQDVYDIEVSEAHNFIGNGAVLHNCSLYPNLIIAYNIDYSTCVFDPTIPDELCHIMEWEDHISCKHDPKVIEKARLTKTIDTLMKVKKNNDKILVSRLRKQRSEITKSLNKNVMCEKRKYRFLKVTEENPEFRGVLPTVVQSLLEARKETRKEIGKLKDSLRDIVDESERKDIGTRIDILNQKQLAYKISANSMYGITGVKAGMLPFMPVAMTITYLGRKSVLQAAAYGKEKFNGLLVASDTDSTYFSFEGINNPTQLWDHAIKVAEEISLLFPPPMKIEFEDAIYKKFLILTKKRYMYQSASRDGTIKPEIGKRGVVLNRRDNSAFIRKTYENIVKIIFENVDSLDTLKNKVIASLTKDIDSMFNHELPTEDFVITKSTGDYGNLQAQYFLNEKGIHRAALGQYNVPFLTDDIREEEGIETQQEEMDWYLDKLPAHIQLLEKIKRRGLSRNEGSRLEYVIVETNDLKAKQSTKIENLSYYIKNKGILNIDYLYYLHRLINPIDQILEVIFDLKDFMKIYYNHRLNHKKLTIELNNLFTPKFKIEKDRLYLIKSGSKYWIKNEKQQKQSANSTFELILKLKYIPKVSNFYSYLKLKYGPNTTLKTQFVFTNDYILLGDMTESKLIAAIKKECKN